MSSSWADDLEEYVRKDEKKRREIGFGSPHESSPLDVFVFDNNTFPFEERKHVYVSSDDYLQQNKHKKKKDFLNWDAMKRDMYKRSILLKCEQHAHLKELILSYYGWTIQEQSGHPFWGETNNEAGKVLEEVSRHVKKEIKSQKTNSQKINSEKRLKMKGNIFDVLSQAND